MAPPRTVDYDVETDELALLQVSRPRNSWRCGCAAGILSGKRRAVGWRRRHAAPPLSAAWVRRFGWAPPSQLVAADLTKSVPVRIVLAPFEKADPGVQLSPAHPVCCTLLQTLDGGGEEEGQEGQQQEGSDEEEDAIGATVARRRQVGSGGFSTWQSGAALASARAAVRPA